MARYDDLDTKLIGLVAGVSAVLTFVIVGTVQFLYYDYAKAEFVRKEVEVPIASANHALAKQAASLEKYAWVDKEKGIVAIPIEEAMGDIVEEFSPAETDSTEAPETDEKEETESTEATE